MSRTETMRRYVVPVAIAVVAVLVAAGAGIVSASHTSDLPERSAAELLVDMQNSDVSGLSGTVVAIVDPRIPELGLTRNLLEPGSRTIRVWYAAPDRVRVALLDKLGETDLIRNGPDVWQWDSGHNVATHVTLPEEAANLPLWPPNRYTGTSPMAAAEQVLAAIEPGTQVSTDGAAEVAGRSAYELVLKPKVETSLVAQVRLAVDAETGVPLRTQIFSVHASSPALEVAFSRISFTVPDAQNFTFNAPAGVEVVEGTDGVWGIRGPGVRWPEPEFVGEGWNTVAVVDVDMESLIAELTQWRGARPDPAAVLDGFEAVGGEWGAGHLTRSSLLTVLLTDDGRLLIGAVTPQRLYEVAGMG